MTMFINELKRVFSIKRMLVILCILIISGVLYFNEQKSNILYKQYSNILETENYYDIDWAAMDNGVSRLMLERMEYAEKYNEKIGQVISQAEKNLEINIFSKKGSFSYNNQKKIIEDFSGIKDIKLEIINDSAISTFYSYNYLVFFMLAAMLVIVDSMNLNNKKSLSAIIYATPGGRYRLGVVRTVVIVLSAVLISTLFIFTHLIIAFSIYGGMDILNKPIQSMREFMQFCDCITIGEGIIRYGVYTACGLAIVGLVMWFLLGVFKNLTISVGAAAVITIIEFILFYIPSQSIFVFFRYTNIFSLIMSKNWMTEYINVNLFSHPIAAADMVNIFALLVLSVSALLCVYMAGKRIFGSETVFTRAADNIEIGYNRLISHIPVWAVPVYTLITKHKGGLLFILFVVLLMNNGKTAAAQYDIVSKIKCEIYEAIETLNQAEKEEYLQGIVDEYMNLCDEADEISERFFRGDASAEEYYTSIIMVSSMGYKVYAVQEIQGQMASLQSLYSERGIEGTIVNEAAFSYLIGNPAADKEEFNLVCLYLCIVLFAASVFAYDDEKNVRPIIISSQNGRTGYCLKKIILLIVFNLLLCLTEFYIFGKNVIDVYGFKHGDAYVQSLSWLAQYPFEINIYSYIFLVCLYRVTVIIAITLIISGITIIFSRFIGIVVGVAGLMPYLIYRLGIKVMKPLSVIRYIQCSAFQKGSFEVILSFIILAAMLMGATISIVLGIRNWKKIKK